MKKIFVLLFFISARVSGQEVEVCLKPVIDTDLSCISEDTDGGWIAGGSASAWSSFSTAAYIAKFDSAGSVVFNTTLPYVSGETENVWDITPVPDGYLAISMIINCCDCGAGGKILAREIDHSGTSYAHHTLLSRETDFFFDSDVATDTAIYIGIDDSLYCFNSGYNLVWKKSIAPKIVGKLIVNDSALVVSYANGLYYFDKSDGSQMHNFPLTASFSYLNFMFSSRDTVVSVNNNTVKKINIINNVTQSVAVPDAVNVIGKTGSNFVVSQSEYNGYSKLLLLNANLQQIAEYEWENKTTMCTHAIPDTGNFIVMGMQANESSGYSSFLKEFDNMLNTADLRPDIGVTDVIMDSAYVSSFYDQGGWISYSFKVRTSVKVHNFSSDTIDYFNLSVILSNYGICTPPAAFREFYNAGLLPAGDTLIYFGWVDGYVTVSDTTSTYSYTNCFSTATPDNKIDSNSSNDNGCSSITVLLPVGIEETQATTQLSVFPNPCSKDITCSFSYFNSGSIVLVLSNLAGQELITQSSFIAEKGIVTMDISTLPAGNYFLSVHFPDGNVERRKIIKA